MNPVAEVRRTARPLRDPQGLGDVLARTSSARYVLIGEASHGTSEFHTWRAELTRRLIIEQGFSFVAVEGDWPDCHQLHLCVTGAPGVANDPAAVLWEFERWPRWMWANEEMADFARWLRRFNTARSRPVGFHGLDVYSLWDSLHAVLEYLRTHEPDRVDAALAAYRCFEPYSTLRDCATRIVPQDLEPDVVRMLAGLRQPLGSLPGLDPAFPAWQNGKVLAGAERYYREMMRGGVAAWNVRDQHMADTLDRLVSAYGPHAKAVVWAHNTHIGDARATDMAAAGMVTIGQLARDRHAAEGVVLVGFGSHSGSVIAADSWDGPVRRLEVPAAQPDSVEDLMHQAVPDGDSVFVLGESTWPGQVRGHRAIGVVYDPDAERSGTYVPTILDRRYDAFVHCDQTTALRPLHQTEYAR